MNSSTYLGAAIATDDLKVLADVAMLRLPWSAAESHRIERMRSVLDAETELARAFDTHAKCSLINFRGSPGVADLGEETETLSAALERYGSLVRQVASEYRRFVVTPNAPLESLPGAQDAGLRRAG
jgi:hypothetical protein